MTSVTGSCQCGAVRYEAEASLDHPVSCNCSRCQRLGAVLVFTPKDKFRLLSGAGSLSEYLFNRKVIRHQFCKTCGIEPFAYGAMPDGTEVVALNVNCMEGVDPRALTPTLHNGRSA